MAYALVFAVLAVYLAALAVHLGDWGWFLLWPAISFGVLAAAYATGRPALLGKRVNGRVAIWAWAILLPYFLLSSAVWHLWRIFDRKASAHEVAPGLWVGRRAFGRELPPSVALVIDLTAEFPEPRAVRASPTYRCLPILDAVYPDEVAFRRLVEEAATCPGVVFVHCAQGHGRSGAFAAAVLVRRGLAADWRSALAAVRKARPGVRINRVQARFLERVTAERK